MHNMEVKLIFISSQDYEAVCKLLYNIFGFLKYLCVVNRKSGLFIFHITLTGVQRDKETYLRGHRGNHCQN